MITIKSYNKVYVPELGDFEIPKNLLRNPRTIEKFTDSEPKKIINDICVLKSVSCVDLRNIKSENTKKPFPNPYKHF